MVDFNQIKLADLYISKQRPLCPCKTPGVQMYIANIGGKYVVKRMPDTGSLHAPGCESYEPPPELSGLGEVLGCAIKENMESGMSELRFDFSLSKSSGRAPIQSPGVESDTVKSDGTKLSLRSTLHYLWDGAGLTKWPPHSSGKRGWNTVRSGLYKAAESMTAKGKSMAGLLFIPESFPTEKREAVKLRWLNLATRMANQKPQSLMILVGEIRQFTPSRFGHRLQVNHSPDTLFSLTPDLYKRMSKRFEREIMLSGIDGVRLIAVATFSANAAGIANIEEIALMTVTENWIPFETIHEKALIEKMVHEGRRFTKSMRYNLPQAKPLACAVLTDTEHGSAALYIQQPELEDSYVKELSMLQSDSKMESWTWDTSDFEVPDLPDAGQKITC